MVFHWILYWRNNWEWIALGAIFLLAVLFTIFRRRKLAFGAVLSLLCLCIFAAAYVVSFWGCLTLMAFGHPGHTSLGCVLEVAKGGIGVEFRHGYTPAPDPARDYFLLDFDRRPPKPQYPDYIQLPFQRNWIQTAGILVATGEMSDDDFGTWFKSLFVTVPGWLILAALSVLPIWWEIRRYRNRFPPGHCRKCGFDLRAHKPGDKCPECGTHVAEPPAKPAFRAQTPPPN